MNNLSTTTVNHVTEFAPYLTSRVETAGLRDIYSLYLTRGPIRKYVTYFRAGGGMPLYVGHSEYYDFDHVIRHIVGQPSMDTGYKKGVFGGGKGQTLASMAISGVAETFERAIGAFGYFALDDKIVMGSVRTLTKAGLTVLTPDELTLFAPEQFKIHPRVAASFRPFTEDTVLGWVEGKRLLSGESCWVPAQITLPFYLPGPKEVPIGYFTTGGLAAHISYEEAVYHAVLELFERDAVNLRWNCRQAPEQIEIDEVPSSAMLNRLLTIGKSLPNKFKFYLHRNEFTELPVVTVIGFSPSIRRYAYYAGGGVAFDTAESMLYAVGEYGQSEGTLRALLLAPTWELAAATRNLFHVEEDIDVNDIDHFFKIISYYGYAKNFKKMDWYLTQGEKVPLSSLPRHPDNSLEARYASMKKLLHKHTIDPIVVDVSPQQMPQMRLVKVVCPELTPPYVQNMPMLGSRRYLEVPQKLGWTDRPMRLSELNLDPQPYP
jgi:ribosomal protein S12 methylthiotransferase accessory factor